MITNVYLDPDAVATKLGVKVRIIYRLIRNGDLPAVNVGTDKRALYIIDEAALDRFIAAGGIPSNPTPEDDQ